MFVDKFVDWFKELKYLVFCIVFVLFCCRFVLCMVFKKYGIWLVMEEGCSFLSI